MKKIVFHKKPIVASEVIDNMGTDSDGAIVSFIGRVRNFSRERKVKYLEYELYREMAEKELSNIIDEAFEQWSLNSCFVVQRYGRVEIGEASIIIAVSSPHRDESYKASRYIIDTIKKRVPIWKKEVYSDGSEWIAERS